MDTNTTSEATAHATPTTLEPGTIVTLSPGDQVTVANPPAATSSSDAISRRADAILLKLLERIERDAGGNWMDPLATYEALVRAEAMRRGQML